MVPVLVVEHGGSRDGRPFVVVLGVDHFAQLVVPVRL
jgi:hypothetical protein